MSKNFPRAAIDWRYSGPTQPASHPSPNIDPAFRPALITLKDDKSITGLQQREEGEVLVFVDPAGKEITVPKKEIIERRESQFSLMPANFGNAPSAAEF